MKLLCLVALMLCAFAHAAVKHEIGDSVTADLGSQQLNFHASSLDSKAGQDDQLIAELVELERGQRNLLADTIKAALESFRGVVINGNDDVPVLDPLVIPQIGPFVYTNIGVRATAVVNDFRMDGLAWYVVEDVSVDVLRLALGLKVLLPQLTFTGKYETQAVIALLSHSAGGNYRVFINRLEVSVDTRLGTSIFGGHLFLRRLDIKIDISDVNIRIEGMVGSSVLNNLINSWVQSATQNLLQNELEAVSQMISEELFTVIDELLRDYTLNDLLG